MATVIDSLVVLLNLDTSKFSAEQKKALEQLRKMKGAVEDDGNSVEAWGKKVQGSFATVRDSALRMLAVFTAGAGIKDFIKTQTDSAAAAGRMAYNIGESSREVNTWAAAVKLFGGSSDEARSSMYGLSQSIQQFALTGQSSIVPYLRSIGVDLVDARTGHIKSITQLYGDLADKFSRLTPQQANFIGRALGLDQGTINLLEKGRGAVQQYLDEARRAGVVNDQQAAQFQQLQTALREFGQTAETVGRNLLTELAPGMVRFLGAATQFMQDNPELTAAVAKLAAAFFALGAAVTAVKLGAIVTGLTSIGGALRGIASAAAAIPGWAAGPLAFLWGMWPKAANQGEDEQLKRLGLAPGSNRTDLFGLIQKLEGSGPGAVSPKGAVGRNQIMPATAAQYGFDPTRLNDPSYNDMVARAIETDLNKRYGGDAEAVAVAYNAGPMAADRWLRSGRNDAVLPPETRAYLAHERSLVGAGATTTTTSIGTIIINTRATDAAGIARDLRGALANHSLVVQGNAGPQ